MQYVARQCRSILLLCWGLGPSPFSPAMIPSHLYSTSSSKPPVPPGARCIHIASSSFDHSHQWDDRLCRTRWEVEGAPSSLPLPLAQAHLPICQSANPSTDGPNTVGAHITKPDGRPNTADMRDCPSRISSPVQCGSLSKM